MGVRLITGVMKSGKSKLLIKFIKANKEETRLIIKPSIDSRDGSKIKSRATHETFDAVVIDENNEQVMQLLFNGLSEYKVVFIDEVQFFSVYFIDKLLDECYQLGIDVVASGLLHDFKQQMFTSTLLISNVAGWQKHLKGQCDLCEGISNYNVLIDTFTNELVTTGDSIHVEGDENDRFVYSCICQKCFEHLRGTK